MSENMVSINERVSAGQQIGIMGDYGYSFGTHFILICLILKGWVLLNLSIFFKV